MPSTPPHEFLPLRSVELEVLLSVIDTARHGYAILQDADERNGGRPGFEIPTLYRALRRMRDGGLIESVEAPTADADARREYWRATALGAAVLELELRRLESVLVAGRSRQALRPEGA